MTTSKSSDDIFFNQTEPIRAELFSVERLEQHAASLAAAQIVALDPGGGRPLIPRVRENGRVLRECYQSIAKAIQQEHTITPAADWLVDNFHIVDEQLREIRDDLPKGFYRELPKLASGHLEGFPRVLGVAWAFIAHTDSRFDPEVLRRFLAAYQKVQPLTIGELWAVAITMRVVLVENLRRLAQKIVQSRAARQEADALADHLLAADQNSKFSPANALRRFERNPLPTSFAVQLVQRLRDLDPKVRPILAWLDQRLTLEGTTADDIVAKEHHEQGTANVSVRNVVTSMRLISAFDWQEFVESVSLVDEVLRQDGNFGEKDFVTRDSYRHSIEDLAKGSIHSELEIAERTARHVAVARAKPDDGTDPDRARRMESGFYLISKGRFEFEKELGYKIKWQRRLLRLYVRGAVPGYLLTILVVTAMVLALPLLHSKARGLSVTGLVLIGLLAAIPASDLAIALINRAVTDSFGPRPLPRLDLRSGIPVHLRTMVAVPTLLSSAAEIQEQVERLEVHYLANPDGNIHFALLSDWPDASAETLPADDELLAAAVSGIAGLNKQHGPMPDGSVRFFLFHRKRTWNESAAKWMGWERKRGKLHELNQLLRGSTETHFIPTEGIPPEAPSGVRYVITLDADTRLPRGAAYKLVGTMAHPLNLPTFNERAGRVTEGYAIVQPRITPSLPSDREGSFFQKVFSGPGGIDPYTSAVSDIYQDLFQEGSYTGKGIYDVDAFELAMRGKVPENALLSHDLFEGIFARVALATDVELFEEFPSHFEASAARQHRWARGDWQLLPWIFGFAKPAPGEKRFVPIPAIGRWKAIDNLRRTLIAPAAFLTLIAGWLLTPESIWTWTRFILATIVIPPVLPFLFSLYPQRNEISKRSHFRSVFDDLQTGVSQSALTITFLAFQAWLMTDAIVRTLGRLFFTHKNMLEWMTAMQAKASVDLKLGGMYRRMAGGVVFAAIAFLAIAHKHHHAWFAAAPFIILWAVAPVIAREISLPPEASALGMVSATDAQSMRLISRQTWRYFETFVTPADHSLPPDNFQETPHLVIAHRTSPTNIGLYLLSALCAHDFGWMGTIETVERLEATLATMSQMELFWGHFYNWYDTHDLRPLDPKYVSTVDSGNLAGHLLALANGAREMIQKSSINESLLTGVNDNVRLLRAALTGIENTRRTHTVTHKQLGNAVEKLALALQVLPINSADWAARFVELRAGARTVADIAQTLAQEEEAAPRAAPHPDAPTEPRPGYRSELHAWAEAALASVESHARDASVLIPWMHLDAKEIVALANHTPGSLPEWTAIEPFFRRVPTLVEAPERFEAALAELAALRERLVHEHADPRTLARVDMLARAIKSSAADAAALVRRLSAITETSERLFQAMDFSFLFDNSRKLFAIGYRVTDGALDPNCYDLLASEARLASFVAIAKGDVLSAHWFHLSRALTPVGRGSALISWAGSMFEYLMPALVMKSPPAGLLSQTYKLVVNRQIEYGEERGVPWGISESAYNARDLDFTYQYSSFGVPGLGLKRGLSEDVVIAPYATALAAMIEPGAAAENFTRLTEAGGRGAFGFYEALDYTASRLPEGEDVAIVRSYLAHHQGMSLISLDNVLFEGAMRTRFHAEPIVQATELLLQERVPRNMMVARPRSEEVTDAHVRELIPPVLRRFTTANDPTPRTQMLSNGRYAVMLTAAGSGYSRWQDVAVTRWREDATRDCWGNYIFLRDSQSGFVWSAGYQPTCVEPESYEASFFEDRAEFIRRDGSVTTKLEVVVSPEDDAEVRRVTITNLGTRPREIQVTSFAELCLAPQAADVAHPAFSNLFVETEFVSDGAALVGTRRKQSDKEADVWVAHVVVVEGETVGEVQYETDRSRFLGRCHDAHNPVSIFDGRPLSNTVGSVLDPILSLRRTVRIPPGTTVRIIFSTIVASARDHVLDLADKYRGANIFERTLTLAWTQAQIQLHHLGIGIEEAHLFQRLANAVLFADPYQRPSSDLLTRSSLDRAGLWASGISGDLPIVVVRINEVDDVEIVRQLLRAHEYWRMKQLFADLIIINEKPSSYEQELQGSLDELVHGSRLRLTSNTDAARGSIFLLRADLIPPQEKALLQNVARVVLLSWRGTLAEQMARSQRSDSSAASSLRLVRPARRQDVAFPSEVPDPQTLELFNGFGGFFGKGREYVTVIAEGLATPAPWINVIANPSFGFLASESGSGHTWSLNSHENQLTPWSNDPVTDPASEVIYIRDENTGEVWTPTALPIRDEVAPYIARHGQGYTRFHHGSHGILAELLQFVPLEDSIKISRLTLKNMSGRPRRLSVTGYVEWVLGSSRSATGPYIITENDTQNAVILARSAWQGEFGGRIAFAALREKQTEFTADRAEFIGRNRSLARPLALERSAPLSGKVGAGYDPCATLQTVVELAPGASTEVVFFMGQSANSDDVRALLARYRAADLNEVLAQVTDFWDTLLGTVQVTTPEPAMDLMLNRWLLYQTLSSRVWARAAFYQLSGAYGFRDQLQDVMALALANRKVAHEQILRAASRQFLEGDVQHWWHPPSGRGVRTRISDDLLWLPYAVNQYLEATGDTKILDEVVPFLEGDLLKDDQHDSYFEPRISATTGTIFEHCARALDRSLNVGAHGLPLMGTGDWNDGMNRVGELGKGESVWLGWFLHTNLWEFAKIASSRGEHKRAETWRLHVSALKAALERDGWDGEWYRRAYFDDGAPLGSAQNTECRIDCIAQSWGVISGGAEPGRATRAMAAVDQQLVRRGPGLSLLFTPPFNNTSRDPGYIKGYVPGIRENGGQYSHAAAWNVIAFAELGEGDKAAEIFRMLNPISRTTSRANMHRYKVEPYVLAGDIYAEAPHIGRGGWTWYTGSAGWLYRAGLEWMLGFRVRGAVLFVDPCIPKNWPGYSVEFRYHSATYKIVVENPLGVCCSIASTSLDGRILPEGASIALADDGATHEVLVVLG
jgi:cyclic beta-1,2-glucan synthetase